MTLLYYDPIFLEHDTGSHPENAGRLRTSLDRIETSGLDAKCTRATWQPATREQILHVHSADMVEVSEKLAQQGGGRIDADTVCSEKSFDAAQKAAGAATDAVRRVVAGDDKTAFCMVRPPGHHAVPDRAMGFCLLNNIAVGARSAIKDLGLNKVLIVDWDVHHGNGTQDIFWKDPSVAFLSMHRYPFYPGSGAADEVGAGPGKGTTVNVPIQYGTARQTQLDRFRGAVEDLADKIKPELVMISAGFDSHVSDPIGSLDLESEDFATFTEIVQGVANTHAQGRIVSMLEGGYNPAALAESVEIHIEKLLSG
jgi:acetoin utilization deacetylase AcuC-like enzyme